MLLTVKKAKHGCHSLELLVLNEASEHVQGAQWLCPRHHVACLADRCEGEVVLVHGHESSCLVI
jgi:hypothetical protein